MWAVNTGVKCGCGCVCVVGMGVDVAPETWGEAHEHVCAHAEGESHLRGADVEYTDRVGVRVCGCAGVRVCGFAGVRVCVLERLCEWSYLECWENVFLCEGPGDVNVGLGVCTLWG